MVVYTGAKLTDFIDTGSFLANHVADVGKKNFSRLHERKNG